MIIKCIGCFKLTRVEMTRMDNTHEVYYDCPGHFPYMTSIGGLLRPAQGTLEAAEKCPHNPLNHCILCTETEDIAHYGQNIASICPDHDDAWGKWLDEHPERRQYMSPKGRLNRANWVEVFREFIESMRANNGNDTTQQ